jgi:hypothetical protein
MLFLDRGREMTTLSEDAVAIWNQLGGGDRAQGATTIAVINCTDGKRYCTSNDVNKITDAAVNKARELGIQKIDQKYIDNAGAGFHAEMWAIIQALHGQPNVKPSDVIVSIGASRACCKYCSATLALLNITAEHTSEDLYQSWFNPMTCNEKSKPRPGFKQWQRPDIPDFRNFGRNYWFENENGKYRESL